MMKGGTVKLFALLLSLTLNAGILWLGISIYQSQNLQLLQIAGSDVTPMAFTLEIVGNQYNHSLSESAQLPFAEEEKQNISTGTAVISSDLITSEEENAIKIQQAIQPNIQMPEKSDQSLAPKAKSEALMAHSQSESLSENIVEDPEVVKKPASSHSQSYSQTENREKIADNNHTQKVEMSQDSASSAARTGDQFATDLAAKIHVQIQGCYPESSKRRGEEGIVSLKIVKNRGALSVIIVSSSGFKRLDRCAVSAVEKLLGSLKVDEVPALGINLKPIRFQLR